MKCLFVHDFHAYEYEGHIYNKNMPYDVFKKRYLTVFSEIKICNRFKTVYDKQKINQMAIGSGEGVEYEKNIGFFKGPLAMFSTNIRETIRSCVKESDVVIVRLDSFLGLIALQECRQQNKRYIIEVVGCAWDSLWNYSWQGKIIAPFIFALTKYAIHKADFAIYVTEKFLQTRYPTQGKSEICSNVFIENLDDSVLERRLEKIRKKNNGKIILGTTAAVDVIYKGQEYVIKAIAELKRRGICDIEYQLVGAGCNRRLLEIAERQGVKDKVKFLGLLNRGNVINWLDEIDIYVQPSKQEGLPRALIEAMSRGVASIGTNVAGIPELLNKDMLFSKGDIGIDDLCTKIILLKNEEQLAKHAVINYEKAKKYEEKIINKRRLDFFRNFVKNVNGE